MKWTPIIVFWLAGMATVATIIGFVAWTWRSISRAVTLGQPQGATQ